MSAKRMKKAGSKGLFSRQRTELAALAKLPESQIDTRSIPEAMDWTGAKRGVFYRPVKQQLTLRLDNDVVAWFKEHSPEGTGYQTSINQALREYVKKSAMKKTRKTVRRA